MSINLSKFSKFAVASILSVALITPTFVSADEMNTGAVINDPTLTSNESFELEKLAKEKDRFLELSLTAASQEKDGEFRPLNIDGGEYYAISVTANQQEKNNWCGPASGRQALSFHKSRSGSSTALPSQTTLASKMGTNADGSTTTGIAKALNEYKSTFGIGSNYTAASLRNLTNPQGTFETRIKGVLMNKTNAPILLVQTKFIPRYKGVALRHYITVSAYSYDHSKGTKEVRTVDPHYNNTYYGTHWNPLGSKTSNGVFRASYEAEIGSNLAMAY